MFRLLITILFFLLSLLNFFPVPDKYTWYAGILVPEYPWIFVLIMFPMLAWIIKNEKFRTVCFILGMLSLGFFFSPIVRAYNVAEDLPDKIKQAYNISSSDLKEFHQPDPFSFWQMFSGNGAKKINYTNYHYAVHGGIDLTLNFTPSSVSGIRPCLFVVHGGSWKRGNKTEIEAMNNYFANAGYQVATIDYRLAPKFHSPAPQEDVKSALSWLRSHAVELKIDTNNFVLMGRSAGAQIVLTTAYCSNENGIKGVAAFYGPNDMFWSYDHPDNPWIMDSKMVQRDFLGGTPEQLPETYLAESPLLHVSAKTLPTLLVHGMIDAHVHYEQSVRLSKKLDSFKVKNLLLSLPWATHGCEYNLNGPSGQLSVYTMERFFYSVTR